MKTQKAVLLFGGNIGNTHAVFQNALALAGRKAGKIIRTSEIYSTKAWGPVAQPDFLNMAVVIRTPLPPVMLMNTLLGMERTLGRVRYEKYGPRTIDIDLLFYGNIVMRHPVLTLPHPHIADRRFVLKPCADVVPELIHPQLVSSIRELLESCPDPLEVRLWKPSVS